MAGLNKDARIAVLGAGTSGLTAADCLVKEGYTAVTVFERNDWVGGKVHSVERDGFSYELGAYVVTEAYETVLDLVGEHGLELKPAPPRVVTDLTDGRSRDFGDFLRDHHGLVASLLSIWRFWRLTGRHENV